jgi:hypothetical protein
MPILIQCDRCSSRFKAPDNYAGKVGKCPKCGNGIAVPSSDPSAVYVVPPEHIAEATRKTGVGALVWSSLAVVVSALAVLGWLVVSDQPTQPVAKALPIVAEPVEAAQPIASPIDGTPVTDQPTPPDNVEPQPARPGLGVTLAQFKEDVPIGDAWKVLSETKHDNGRVVYQLINTKMRHVMLMVTGNPDDLGEVCFTFAVSPDMENDESLTRIAGMVHFLSKYSNWTQDELVAFWGRLLAVGAGDETNFKIAKDGHAFWMTPMGTTDGTMYMTGVGTAIDEKTPTLQEWLDAHPVPIGAGLNKHTDKSGVVVNAEFSYKGFRRGKGGNFIGEMTNDSLNSLQFATFKLSIYDSNAELLDTAAIVISNFGAGLTRSFEAYIEKVPSQYFYKIDFENGL